MSAVIRAGSLSHRVTLERLEEAVGASGTVSETWTPYATVWAERVVLSAEEYLSGPGDAEKRVAVFRIRYRADVRLEDRLTHDGVAYDIVEAVELGRKAGLELRGVAR